MLMMKKIYNKMKNNIILINKFKIYVYKMSLKLKKHFMTFTYKKLKLINNI